MKAGKRFLKSILCMMAVLLLTVQPVFFVTGSFPSYGQTGLVNTDRLNLRSGPGKNYTAIRVLSTNTKVEILGSTRGSDGFDWLNVSVNGVCGYLRSDYVSIDYVYNAADTDFEAYMTAQGFPESYKNALRGLHQKYPNWVFIAQHTGLDWNTAVTEESRTGLNLVHTNNISSYKSSEEGAFDYSANYWPGFDGSVWVAASRELIEHYMDPRNFLTDPYVFQFQSQVYDPSIQTKDGLIQMVRGTFLEGSPSNVSCSSESYGPGFSGNSTSVFDNGPSSGKASESGNGVQLIGPQASVPYYGHPFLCGITALADWKLSDGSWYYLNSDGTKNVSGWFWIDGNKDGISECYYFDENGVMAFSCSIGDYAVNADGQWIVDGTVQKKSSSVSSSVTENTGSTGYVDMIMKGAEQSGVSPYVLAAMIIQEQGTEGKSEMISGKNSQYYGYYNFYNIAAYEHDGMTAVQAGLKYASENGNAGRPWNTVEKGIVGGATAYGANYVDNGQDTLYLKKFNVQGTSKYKHQFMSNVIAAAQEGAKLSGAYSKEIKESALCFRIPVYSSMPESACPLPTGDGSPNERLKTLTVNGASLNPSLSIGNTEYQITVNSSVNTVQISAQAIDSHASIEGYGTITLNSEVSDVTVRVKAENGKTREYHIRITKSPDAGSPAGSQTAAGGPGVVNNGEISVSNPKVPATGGTGTESSVVIGIGPM